MKPNRRHCWTERVFLMLAIVWASTSFAEPPAPRNAKDRLGNPTSGQRKVIGLRDSNCLACHGNATPKSEPELSPDLGSRGSDGWFLGDEILTWNQHDHHYHAFSILLNEPSRQIARHLGIVDQAGESLVHRDRRCLSCHSSMPVEQMTLQGDLVQSETSGDPRYTIGVSCEACHGPAGKGANGADGWGVAHTKREFEPAHSGTWRTLTPQKKFDDFGYWDIHSTRTQTRVCLTCHLGNAEQQKVITHEMYAAGHPPLPSFELSQFIHQMPRHWRRLDEKPRELREEFLEQTRTQRDSGSFAVEYDPKGLAVAKATMIAALVTLEESMHLTADLMNDPADAVQPELANYACFGCHHELVRDGWRKTRRLTTTPGRPTLHEWPFALASIVAASQFKDAADSPLKMEIGMVAAALNSQPYGNATDLRNATRSLATAAESQARKLSSLTIDRERAVDLLRGIARYASIESVDYDSARQFIWAYERTQAELKSPPEPWVRGQIPKEWIGGNPSLQELEQSMVLWLPANRNKDGAKVELHLGNKPFDRIQHSVDVSKTLDRIANYHPDTVRNAFKVLEQWPPLNIELQK